MASHCTAAPRRPRRTWLAAGCVAATLLATPGAAGAAPADPVRALGAEQAAGTGSTAPRSAALADGGRVELSPGDGTGPASIRVTPAKPGAEVGAYAFGYQSGTLRVQPGGRPGPVRVTELSTGAPNTGAPNTGAPAVGVAPRQAAVTYPVSFTVPPLPNAAYKVMFVWNRATWAWGTKVDDPEGSRFASANLPAGDYFAVALLPAFGGPTMSLLATPFTVTDAGAQVTFSSSTVETRVAIDDPAARRQDAVVWLSVPGGDLAGFASGNARTSVRVTPFQVPGVTMRLHEVLVPAGGSESTPVPYRYNVFHEFVGGAPADPVVRVAAAGLARSVTTVRALGGAPTTGRLMAMPVTRERAGIPLGSAIAVPGSITEYVTPGVAFDRSVDVGEGRLTFSMGSRTLAAGANPAATVGVAPLMPRRSEWSSTTRSGDTIEVREHARFDDAAKNLGSSAGVVQSARLTSGGRTLAEVTDAAPDEPLRAVVDPAPATYELTHVLTRQVPWSLLSTEVRSEWAFRSASTSFSEDLPLVAIDLRTSGLDDANAAGDAPVQVSVQARTWSTGVDAVVTGLEFSTDDGVTWQRLPISGSTAELRVPATAAFVSLRATATGEDGGSLRRTVIRAFGGPAR